MPNTCQICSHRIVKYEVCLSFIPLVASKNLNKRYHYHLDCIEKIATPILNKILVDINLELNGFRMIRNMIENNGGQL